MNVLRVRGRGREGVYVGFTWRVCCVHVACALLLDCLCECACKYVCVFA